MIKQNVDGMVILEELTLLERMVFIKFLRYEKLRHQEDINLINNTIKILKEWNRAK